jgi:PAS domain S-box-containing protein
MNTPDDTAFDSLFAPEMLPPALPPWKLLVVDDEPDIHAVLRLALHDMAVLGRRLQLLDAADAQSARALLAQHPDTALMLVDVVMETEQAGLDLVQHVRRVLHNNLVQIVLVTGQPGYAPQREVVTGFEINGYRLKAELTADRIFTTVYTALRTHQVALDLQAQREQAQQQALALQAQTAQLADYQAHLERLVLERTAELERQQQRLLQTQFAMDRVGIGIVWSDADTGRLTYVNDQACAQLGYTREELLALQVQDLNPQFAREGLLKVTEELRSRQHSSPCETVHRRKDGSLYPAEVTVVAHRTQERDSCIAFFSDITHRKLQAQDADARLVELTEKNAALQRLNQQLTQAHGQLLQSEKMASIGLLAAGVAHEINNPVGYVKSNLNSLVQYLDDFERVLQAYEAGEAACSEAARCFAGARQIKEELDFGYTRQDLPSLLSESVAGLDRVTRIVQNLKDFSRLDCEDNWTFEDLHRGLDSTLNVVWNHLKYTCEVQKEYGELPPVQCLLSQLNQIFLNLLVNAADAIEGRGTITIRTGTQGDEVWVEVEDTGKGIPKESLGRIFDPFFTTKPVGKGTGLGLSVSYSIVRKHNGRIEVDSTVGTGTRFRVWLPREQPGRDATAAAALQAMPGPADAAAQAAA